MEKATPDERPDEVDAMTGTLHRCAMPPRLWNRGFYTAVPATEDTLKIVDEMRATPCLQPEHAGVELMEEDTDRPLDFARRVETELANHKVVVVSCLMARPILLDVDSIHQHLALSPYDLVSVSGTSPIRGRCL